MYVRLSRFGGLALARLGDVVEAFKEREYVDGLAALDGFAGYVLAANTRPNDWEGLTVLSLWRTEQDLVDSDGRAHAQRAQRAWALRPSRPPLVERYAVALERDGGAFGPFLRLSRLSQLTGGAADEVVDAFRQGDYLDQQAASPGFRGYLLLTSLEGDAVTAISSWRSREDVVRSDAFADAARAVRIAASGAAADPIVDHYEVLLDRRLAPVR